MPSPHSEIIVVGAGLAGLACAQRLQQKGIDCVILEASNRPGGRVRTDTFNGFRLDRGFQVLLTAYPETSRALDYPSLKLRAFHAGAIIRSKGRLYRFGDPLRHWADALPTMLAPVSTFTDKLRVLGLRDRVCSPSLEKVLDRPETTTAQRLREYGFSETLINSFFRPFLGGVFLEPDLITSSRKFEFVFRMFSLGEAVLPAHGMQAIPDQMAHTLKPGTIRFNTRVAAIAGQGVHLSDGQFLSAAKIIVATDQPETNRLQLTETTTPQASTTCLYYEAPVSPVRGPWLVLNGDEPGPINNLCVPTELHRSYSSNGSALISITVLKQADRQNGSLESAVRTQLTKWYGKQVSQWQHVRTYEIPQALPLQSPPALTPVDKPIKIGEHLFVCGDHTSIASIEGAISSGRRAAEAVTR